jgi:hypothetical protein
LHYRFLEIKFNETQGDTNRHRSASSYYSTLLAGFCEKDRVLLYDIGTAAIGAFYGGPVVFLDRHYHRKRAVTFPAQVFVSRHDMLLSQDAAGYDFILTQRFCNTIGG